jgi:hypothetical protein
MLRSLLSAALAAVLAITALPWCWMVLQGAWQQAFTLTREPWPADPLAVGCGVLAGVCLMVWKRPNWFVHTAIHELCHLLMCMALFVPVNSFRATRGQGGEVTHLRIDALRETLISIAPYTVPLVLLPCLLALHFAPAGHWHELASGCTGFASVHHLNGLFHNVRLNARGKGSDLVKIGRPLSVVLILGTLMLVTAWVITLLGEKA